MAGTNEVIGLIARHGGFPACKGDGEPSGRTLWLGISRVLLMPLGSQWTVLLRSMIGARDSRTKKPSGGAEIF